MPLSSAPPDAIVGASAILMPSRRTYGCDPAIKLNLDAAEVAVVESNARKLDALVSPALVASVWQIVSAASAPELGLNEPLDIKAMRPATGVMVRVLVWEVSKQ